MVYKVGDYSKYHKSKRMKVERASRNKNRKTFQVGGKVRKGDGKHIDHRDGNPKNNSRRNLAVVPARRNRKKQ